ncbi:conserved exported protein of unknown function [Shewanella benthica]|uniref:Porin domain-containing protein n=1 Tax=Shewanella benthica TaxID=43661 RepID=A0A330LYK8_9GAMM|nr:hypothetical protein [Shewanella benthica]SQH75001.1 conserved exported protein of unknown function [Shewanella benthica]
MKKIIIFSAVICAMSGAQASSLDNIKISGFGSVAVGKSSNDIVYAGYDSERWNVSQDTLAGIQLDAKINDKTKFVTQVVANGRYDYELAVEMAYVSYETNLFTVRAGKLRTPFFMYSDYLDVGYAYPMLRPSQELYENLIVSSYMGMDLLIPIEFEDSSLVLQPIVGIGEVNERDSRYGQATLDQLFGLSAHWYVEDFTFRASYVAAQTDYSAPNDYSAAEQYIYNALLDDKKGTFTSVGAQYDNGDLLVSLEAAEVTLEDDYYDTLAISGLLGYRFGSLMPYVMANMVKTTDDDERSAAYESFSFKRAAYSLGARWDFARNIALKLDLTYADFMDTNGGFINSNADESEDNTLVYSVAVDFIF